MFQQMFQFFINRRRRKSCVVETVKRLPNWKLVLRLTGFDGLAVVIRGNLNFSAWLLSDAYTKKTLRSLQFPPIISHPKVNQEIVKNENCLRHKRSMEERDNYTHQQRDQFFFFQLVRLDPKNYSDNSLIIALIMIIFYTHTERLRASVIG